jgi:hypothetical protein
MAVDERGDQPAVDIAGKRGVIGPGAEMTHAFFPVPETLDLQALGVQAAAPIAVAHVIRVIILKGFQGHPDFLISTRIAWVH